MCGFIGIYGPDGVDVGPEIYEGLLAVQHRGQDAAGITTFTNQFHVKKGFGLVRDVFNQDNMARLRGHLGVGHVRYPTVGAGREDEDAQPFHLPFPVGIAMAHNGNVTNFHELREAQFASSGTRLNSSCDLEVILYVFARGLNERIKPGEKLTPDTVFAAIQDVFKEVKGAYSVVAALPDVGLVAFRDPFGIKPICFGTREDEDGKRFFAVASESVVLDVAGYSLEGDLAAGEAMLIDTERNVTRRQLGQKPHRPCVFEFVYFARPDSMVDGISVYRTRRRLGEIAVQLALPVRIQELENDNIHPRCKIRMPDKRLPDAGIAQLAMMIGQRQHGMFLVKIEKIACERVIGRLQNDGCGGQCGKDHAGSPQSDRYPG